MKYPTTKPAPPPPPNRYIVQPVNVPAYQFLGCCPKSQTYVAYSAKMRCTIIFPLPCNQWSCRYCAQNKTKRLAYRVSEAAPNRLLTLTVDPKLYVSPREAFDATRAKVPILARKLRLRFGEFEYIRVTEATARGWPHYHLLVRSKYIPHQVVKKLWQELTGAQIVDLRQVNRDFRCYTYLLKYLSKMHELEWTARHVSTTRSFFPKEDPWEPEDLDLAEGTFHNQHPANFLVENYQGKEVIRFQERSFLVDAAPPLIPFEGERELYLRSPQPA